MAFKRRATTPPLEFEGGTAADALGASEPLSLTGLEFPRQKLRQRWELASVLNFLSVFKPVIGKDLKISAEEIEVGLITPNSALAKLHTAILKGITPNWRTLDSSDAWVAVLLKILQIWWPWVAEGDLPLAANKGEEVIKYKELDPIARLLVLKALCEIRAIQDDIISYINHEIKRGNSVSTFRKAKIGGNEHGISYWYVGDDNLGYRLYKEVNQFDPQQKVIGNKTLSTFKCKWETLATNFDEFLEVVAEFSSSQAKMEVAVGKALETGAIAALEKLKKKKERAVKRQQKQQMLLNGFQNARILRSTRNRKHINYNYDSYDEAIKDAIRVIQTKKTAEEPRYEFDQNVHGIENKDVFGFDAGKKGDEFVGDSDNDCNSEGNGCIRGESKEGSDSGKDGNNHSNCNKGPADSGRPLVNSVHKADGRRGSRRLARHTEEALIEVRSPAAKNRLRQRPTRNTAIESCIVPDSDD